MESLIRPWQKEDFPAVRRILWGSWIAAYSPFIPVEDLRAYFEATYQIASLDLLYDNPLVYGFIGEANGEAAGYARTQLDKRENRFYLASLYLLPAFQGKGIGGALLCAAEKRAQACDLDEIWVGVMTKNEAAGRWYEQRGFAFVREEPFRMGGTTVSHRIGFKDLSGLSGKIPEKTKGSSLIDLADALLERQKKTWSGLARGYGALGEAQIREIRCDGWGVKVQFNPQRIVSSGANLDPETLRQRPCFLCSDNRPPEQEALSYRDDYLILCNPMPIFPGHLTIAHRCHLPQSLLENLPTFLRLAEDLGPRMFVFYNGPRSGASAPDHLHFQAAPAGHLPVEAEIAASGNNRSMIRKKDGVVLWRTEKLGRGILVIEGENADEVAAVFDKTINALARLTPSNDEPMLNLFGAYTGKAWRLLLIPRRKHRPDAYFREGKERLLISPGAVDMGGILITPAEKDFLLLDRYLIEEIFREVSFDDAAIEALLDIL
jgi:ribosomal protein S18 acetylase RimI-like enzyme